MDDCYHIPVMLEECLEGMNIEKNGCYLDVTFGGGGHSRAILSHLGAGGRLYSVDQDNDAVANVSADARFTFIASNFRHIDRFMDYYGELGNVDAILADLGVSSHQFDEGERGFSFRASEPLLDMRMNVRSRLSARQVINTYEEERLAAIIYEYGELRQSRQLASRICRARQEQDIETIGDLLEVVRPAISPKEEKRQLSMLFQAIRIEVNDELGALKQMLEAATRVLRPGGRLVVMTYHSLEDRIVKNFLRSYGVNGWQSDIYGSARAPWRLLTRKPIVASPQEQERNPRSRSAKLRIAEWLPS
ncbi:MAG: 16S rRNA (cytosine(1402)-N(4))-methyltransferase RsmH [Porphyromonadaceae bacterium]|nr:16S rRNA (cytosine(1402)-N(4))-methyltransferase RsmH [Porphyromonadaceae bacterium]